jgi:hypothetical protein
MLIFKAAASICSCFTNIFGKSIANKNSFAITSISSQILSKFMLKDIFPNGSLFHMLKKTLTFVNFRENLRHFRIFLEAIFAKMQSQKFPVHA